MDPKANFPTTYHSIKQILFNSNESFVWIIRSFSNELLSFIHSILFSECDISLIKSCCDICPLLHISYFIYVYKKYANINTLRTFYLKKSISITRCAFSCQKTINIIEIEYKSLSWLFEYLLTERTWFELT